MASSPDARSGHGMVTDTTRSKILLFAGQADYYKTPIGPSANPMRKDVWEWDGSTLTWTNRTVVATATGPTERMYPTMAYDEGRQKLFLYDGMNYGGSPSQFWEWDPISMGWATRDTKDALQYGYNFVVTYDSLRRREVLLTAGIQETWELDAKGPTWYVRSIASSPWASSGTTMVFDTGRGVAVAFGGQSQSSGTPTSDTWEYKVTNLGKGEGCTLATAASCATGFCVDGVCCEAAACTGACKSCSVDGLEGTCVLAKAGTEVVGSCSAGQACDGSGNCTTKNGQACTSASACASGFCADGVCCDSACTGACASCNLAGQVGKCSPYAAGTDPQNECGKGTGVCKSTCDGVGNCAYPGYSVSCGNCTTCDGYGTCSGYDPYCYYGVGGAGGYYYPMGGSGGYIPNFGGAGGYIPYGGSGGYVTSKGGAAGSVPNVGGSGGYNTGRGGSGGSSIPNVGGSGASTAPSVGGSGGFSIPNVGGSGASTVPSVGGRGGSIIPSAGGSMGTPDGAAGDAGAGANLHKSGCNCELGHAQPGDAGLTTPLLMVGLGLLLARKRRRKR
ncbi:MAG TPA: hypothetical protein VF550_18210 [Polyangia bacterium]